MFRALFVFSISIVGSCGGEPASANLSQEVYNSCASDYRRIGASGIGCLISRSDTTDEVINRCALIGYLLNGAYESGMKFVRPDLIADDGKWASAVSEMSFQNSVFQEAANQRAKKNGLDLRQDAFFQEQALSSVGVEPRANAKQNALALESGFAECRRMHNEVSRSLYEVKG